MIRASYQTRHARLLRRHRYARRPISHSRIGIVGFGHMGKAITHCFIQRGVRNILVSNDTAEAFRSFKIHHRNCCAKYLKTTLSNAEVAKKSEVTILAVKPSTIGPVIEEIAPLLKSHFNKKMLLSIAAGIPLHFIKKHLTGQVATRKSTKLPFLVRIMPNLPAQIGQGISVWKSATRLPMKYRNLVKSILGAFGEEFEVQNEELLNAAGAICGSGPAYVFTFLDSLYESGNKFGFTQEQARILALQTTLGAAQFAKNSSELFSTLTDQVKTKGGITEAAFKILDKKVGGKSGREKSWKGILQEAVKMSFKRSKELARKA